MQLPAREVVSEFTLSGPELTAWFKGNNLVTDYLVDITMREMEERMHDSVWSKVIWDVTAVAWLLNDDDRFMVSRVITAPLPSYDNLYTQDPKGYPMRYVYKIRKNPLLKDLIAKLTRE